MAREVERLQLALRAIQQPNARPRGRLIQTGLLVLAGSPVGSSDPRPIPLDSVLIIVLAQVDLTLVFPVGLSSPALSSIVELRLVLPLRVLVVRHLQVPAVDHFPLGLAPTDGPWRPVDDRREDLRSVFDDRVHVVVGFASDAPVGII